MIIFQYLFRQLIASTAAVCSVLLLVFLSARFVKYLAEVAIGKWEAGVVFAFIGYRLPGFLELLLPLSFFIAVMLAYGRLYLDSEMTVLSACGMSQKKLLGYTLVSAVVVAAVVGWLSLAVTPAGMHKYNELVLAQEQRGELDAMPSKRFHKLSRGGVAYAEEVENGRLQEVFHTETRGANDDAIQVLVLAKGGHQERSENRRDNFLVLEEGYRIEGQPGRADFRITYFSEFGKRLAQTKRWGGKELEGAEIPTAELWGAEQDEHVAALHRRLGLPLMVIVVTILAVPLSKTNPRQGRYFKLLPAMVLFMVYFLALQAGQDKVSEGELNVYVGVWGIHALFMAVALLFFCWGDIRRRISRRPGAVT